MTIKIGDTLYSLYSMNRRGGKWIEHKITGETKISWLLDDGWKTIKVNKKTMSQVRDPVGPSFFTKRGMEDRDFCDANRRNLAGIVETCTDADKLRAIAAILGVKI